MMDPHAQNKRNIISISKSKTCLMSDWQVFETFKLIKNALKQNKKK